MAEVEFMHLCDYAFQAEGGKPCIIGIFDGIGAPAFPATHMLMTLAMQFRGTPHEVAPVKIDVGRPNGESLAALEGQIAMSGEGAAFIDFKLANLPFPEPGRYTITVTSAGRVLASQTLRVTQVSGPTGIPGPPPHTPPNTPLH